MVMLGSGVLLFTLISCACVFSYFFSGDKPDKKTGVIRISEVRWSMGDKKAIPGSTHKVLVSIERVDCKGKITITLKDLPPGVNAGVVTLAPNAIKIEVPFTVSYGTDPLTKEVKVYAECEADGATAEMPMTLIVKEDPLKKK
jgi:hypothetical protein